MPRRSILSAGERTSLLAVPDKEDELIRHYTLTEPDLSLIRQRRGEVNRLGFAVQLCYLRFPSIILGADQSPDPALLVTLATSFECHPMAGTSTGDGIRPGVSTCWNCKPG